MYLEEFSYYDEVARQSYIKGEAKKAIKVAKKMLSLGLTREQIAEATELTIADVRKLAGEVV